MPLVGLKGVFMGANVKTSTFEGNSKSSLMIDLYQPDSPDTEKTVQVKSDDLGLLNKLSQEYSMGSVFECTASVNAYKNKAYYKLHSITE
jgi:hypothetical protein